jgi:hypothetical protein
MTKAEKVALYTLYEQIRLDKCGIDHVCKNTTRCSCLRWAKSRVSWYIAYCLTEDVCQ